MKKFLLFTFFVFTCMIFTQNIFAVDDGDASFIISSSEFSNFTDIHSCGPYVYSNATDESDFYKTPVIFLGPYKDDKFYYVLKFNVKDGTHNDYQSEKLKIEDDGIGDNFKCPTSVYSNESFDDFSLKSDNSHKISYSLKTKSLKCQYTSGDILYIPKLNENDYSVVIFPSTKGNKTSRSNESFSKIWDYKSAYVLGKDSANCFKITVDDNYVYPDVSTCEANNKSNKSVCVDESADLHNSKVSDGSNVSISNVSSICHYYDLYLSSIEKYYGKAKDCDYKNDDNCYTNNVIKADNNINSLTEMCYSIIKSRNYDDQCVIDCLKVSDEISFLKKEYNIDNYSGACGLSEKIVKLFANVLKWFRYIAPALVIILGILDFIKAIASQSEDEMKKSQGRFIKRLIAAVLLFLIPFLILYLLDAFHLVTDNPYCNII